ncbi:DUF262 domain-containing protein [Adhaeribacter radiodurans]|uniref:DUF262 domain-containing protein n=1 Tax=Adhaeribacter radiodurans TaxID=2745197 RepID=A0A7L7L1K1_9BACT|nr:DUF262 domain-containing protein [Adhaeribacter radiodurans]QMU26654.1 DUF262 domain-containing protein [Adhaeribacter radiodurans]
MENLNVLKKFTLAQESLVVQQSDFSLKIISEMVENGAVDIAPHYQRRERWDLNKQSSLIESFILNVPVPPVYLSEDDYGIYSVIDGKQRITSIRSFIKDQFPLKDLKKFPELNGLTFSELPPNIKNALSVRPYLRVVTLLKQSDPDLKYEVFLRLNTGGEKLKAQEIRNVAYSGRFNDLLFELSENEFLKDRLKINNENSNAFRNMDDLEHVLRFFTLNEKWQNIGNVLSIEMDKYMAENRNPDDRKVSDLRFIFNETIESCKLIWNNKSFHKYTGNSWREQMISPLYDAQMVATSRIIIDGNISTIKTKSEEILEGTKQLFENDFDFVKSISQATNNPANISIRINKIYDLLNGLI